MKHGIFYVYITAVWQNGLLFKLTLCVLKMPLTSESNLFNEINQLQFAYYLSSRSDFAKTQIIIVSLKLVFFLSILKKIQTKQMICRTCKTTGLVLLWLEFVFLYLICLFNYIFIEKNNFVSALYKLCCYSNCVWCDKAHVVSVRGKIGRGELMHEGSTPTFA